MTLDLTKSDMWMEGVERRKKDMEEFYNSPDFDRHRFDSMTEQLMTCIKTTPLTKDDTGAYVCFRPPTSGETSSWWKRDPSDSYAVKYGINRYTWYVLAELDVFDVLSPRHINDEDKYLIYKYYKW